MFGLLVERLLNKNHSEGNTETVAIKTNQKLFDTAQNHVPFHTKYTKQILSNETMQGFIRKLRNLPIIYESIRRECVGVRKSVHSQNTHTS